MRLYLSSFRLGDHPERFVSMVTGDRRVAVICNAIARSGADRLLVDLLRRDALVYAGYSAGPCVLAPSLRGLELCDDPSVVPASYGEPVIWDGLGVLEHAFVPHFDSPDHVETELIAQVAAHYRATNTPHLTLRDGQALVINGPTREIT